MIINYNQLGLNKIQFGYNEKLLRASRQGHGAQL